MRIFSTTVWFFALAGLGWGTSWRTPEARLTPPSPATHFGKSLVTIGDVAFVGSDGGVFEFHRLGDTWSAGTRLATDGLEGGQFGDALSGDGQYLAVGDPDNNKIYIFSGGEKGWVQVAKIQPFFALPGLDPGTSEYSSIAMSGSTLFVGSYTANQVKFYSPAPGGWMEAGSLLPSGGGQGGFGASLAVSGDTLVVGAPAGVTGAAYVFQYTGGAQPWTTQPCTCGGSGLSALTSSAPRFGMAVAVDGDTVLVSGASGPGDIVSGGSVFAFFRQNGIWSNQGALTSGTRAGIDIAISGDIAVTTPPTTSLSTVPVFARSAGYWFAEQPLAGSESDFGNTVALSGNMLLVGALSESAVYAYRVWNVSLTSSPPGRAFTTSGAGCAETGAFTTPYNGLWTNCTVQFDAVDSTPDTRYTFQGWADGGSQNPRTFLTPATTLDVPYSFVGDYLTEYQLTAQAVPVSGGGVTGGGWYAAGGRAVVTATPNPGFLFAGFSGALSGFATPQTLTMNAPQTVTGSFAATPPAVLNATISAKSGTAADRLWTISVTNAGPGTAYNAQLFVLSFTQTFGTACTALPVRLTPAALPAALGSLATQSTATTQVALDFTGCPTTARFTVNIGYMSNGGASAGMIQLVNQFQ